MIWPSDLLTATNLNVFHADDDSGPSMSRYRFFMICTAAAFAFYFLPGLCSGRQTSPAMLTSRATTGFLMSCLTYFSWVCWIAPSELSLDFTFDQPALMAPAQTTLSSINYSASIPGLGWESSPSIGLKFPGLDRLCSRRGGQRSTSVSASCCVTGSWYRSCTTRM